MHTHTEEMYLVGGSFLCERRVNIDHTAIHEWSKSEVFNGHVTP